MSHAGWYSNGEVATILSIEPSSLWRRLKLGHIPYITDSFIESNFIHESVVNYLVDCYFKKRRFSEIQIKHMYHLHQKALGETNETSS